MIYNRLFCAFTCPAGVTVWRPKTPAGYSILGDIVIPGQSQPTFEVLAVAVNSGLVAYPTAFTHMWSGAGASVWRPRAPEGYLAVGDLLTLDDRMPELSEMVCLHGGFACVHGEGGWWCAAVVGLAGRVKAPLDEIHP
jgi:hypothetical protein